ncbi:MAG: type III secretion system export apparatus subunit SctT [Alphaproteobacteria bacterium]|nr:type III secretion system export apparatus subunit SctT [Alphaproteobacteria bacterium]
MSIDLLNFEWVLILILVFARVYGFMFFFPVTGGDELPALVKVLLCMSLTPMITLTAVSHAAVDLSDNNLFYMLLFKEGLAGSFMGLICGLPLRLMEIVGSMIDNQRGTAVTDTYNPATGSDSSLLGQLLSMAVMVYFFTSGGFDRLTLFLGKSFVWIPLDRYAPSFGDHIWKIILDAFGHYMAIFIILTMPVMVAMFLAEIALAVSSRFAQSLNVFSLAQPIKSLIAVALLVTMVPRLTQESLKWLDDLTKLFVRT